MIARASWRNTRRRPLRFSLRRFEFKIASFFFLIPLFRSLSKRYTRCNIISAAHVRWPAAHYKRFPAPSTWQSRTKMRPAVVVKRLSFYFLFSSTSVTQTLSDFPFRFPVIFELSLMCVTRTKNGVFYAILDRKFKRMNYLEKQNIYIYI